jgi:hypothetical protein
VGTSSLGQSFDPLGKNLAPSVWPMHLVQLLLPMANNQGVRYPDPLIQTIKSLLVEKYGGVTAFTRAPAEGVWAHDGKRDHDDVAMIEVMMATFDRRWWAEFKIHLEQKLAQKEILIRSFTIDVI